MLAVRDESEYIIALGIAYRVVAVEVFGAGARFLKEFVEVRSFTLVKVCKVDKVLAVLAAVFKIGVELFNNSLSKVGLRCCKNNC